MTSAAFRLPYLTDQCSGVVLLLAVAWFTLPGLCAINSRTRARSPSQHASSRLSVISQQLAALLSLAAAVSRRGASRAGRVAKATKRVSGPNLTVNLQQRPKPVPERRERLIRRREVGQRRLHRIREPRPDAGDEG